MKRLNRGRKRLSGDEDEGTPSVGVRALNVPGSLTRGRVRTLRIHASKKDCGSCSSPVPPTVSPTEHAYPLCKALESYVLECARRRERRKRLRSLRWKNGKWMSSD